MTKLDEIFGPYAASKGIQEAEEKIRQLVLEAIDKAEMQWQHPKAGVWISKVNLIEELAKVLGEPDRKAVR